MKLPPYVVLQKPRGKTPLETIEEWRAGQMGKYVAESREWRELKEIPAAYAGRLDPMAEGKLLVLLGDECKRLTAYTKLDKEYEIEVLLDVQTDTGDLLGMPNYVGKEMHPERAAVGGALSSELGAHSHRYPVFSSKTVNGKPLFLYALEGRLNEIVIPEHPETIYRIKHLSTSELTSAQLIAHMDALLSIVPRSDAPSKVLGADFRQDAIRDAWHALFDSIQSAAQTRTFSILKLRVTCASGTYMRTLAGRIGTSLDTSAFALTINRTRIGKYQNFFGLGYWKKEYQQRPSGI